MKISQTKTQTLNFKSVYFEDYNSKYSSIKRKLQQGTERFSRCSSGFSKIGEGICGETFRFLDSSLGNLVIKTTIGNYKDDYEREYNNLISVPADRIGGQEAARVYDSQHVSML